jgi:hypothetical protein
MVSQDSLTLGENVFATKYASKTSADTSNDFSVSSFVITSVANLPDVHNYPSFVECRTTISSNMKEDYFSPSMTWTHSVRNYTYQGSLLLLFLFISFRVKKYLDKFFIVCKTCGNETDIREKKCFHCQAEIDSQTQVEATYFLWKETNDEIEIAYLTEILDNENIRYKIFRDNFSSSLALPVQASKIFIAENDVERMQQIFADENTMETTDAAENDKKETNRDSFVSPINNNEETNDTLAENDYECSECKGLVLATDTTCHHCGASLL